MSDSLIIKDFGPIRSAELDLKRFMLLVGAQASGKSTIAKLLAIFRDIDFLHNEKDQTLLFKHYNINGYFYKNTVLKYTCNDYVIEYKDAKWRIDASADFKAKFKKEQDRVRNVIIGSLQASNRLANLSDEEKGKQITQIYNINWKSLFELLTRQIYIPAERILIAAIEQASFAFRTIPLPGCLTDFGNKFQIARSELIELPVSFFNVKYKNDRGVNKIVLEDGHVIPLSETASGFQTSIPLMLIVEQLSRSQYMHAFTVEEPELSLFPTSQKQMINFLVNKCNTSKQKNDLVITTHSPYVLSILNNLLLAPQVFEKNEAKLTEIDNIVHHDNWIKPDEFNAYYANNGTVTPLMKNGLISQNELDNVSMDINGENDQLMELYMAKQN